MQDASENSPVLAPGTLIADRYTVVGPLGRGGMGEVVIARHLFLKHEVALKIIRPDMDPDESTLIRFEREARIIAQFRGENIARVLDAGRTDDGRPFIAMELLSGEDLEAVVKRSGKLDAPTACRYLLQVCEGLAEAHAIGIVHRDLKPANLFLTTRLDGTKVVKILDFGISKAAPGSPMDSTQRLVTGPNTTLGSPAFMSPEQLRSSRDVDARSDIWALGVILFRLCSVRFPFEGETVTEVVVKAMVDQPLALAELEPNIPRAVVSLVEKCLQKDRANRPQDLVAVATALVPVVHKEATETAARVANILSGGIPAEPAEHPSVPRAALATTIASMPMSARSPDRSKRIAFVALALGIAVAVGFFFRNERPGPGTTDRSLSVAVMDSIQRDAGLDSGIVSPPTADAVGGSESVTTHDAAVPTNHQTPIVPTLRRLPPDRRVKPTVEDIFDRRR